MGNPLAFRRSLLGGPKGRDVSVLKWPRRKSPASAGAARESLTLGEGASSVVARVAFPLSIGPEDGISRFRGGIGRPKVAAAFQAGPELIGRPGLPGTWIGEIHERAAPLAAHLKVDISHSPDSSAEPSGCPAEHVPRGMREGNPVDRRVEPSHGPSLCPLSRAGTFCEPASSRGCPHLPHGTLLWFSRRG